jgi:restriction system protein
VMAARGAAGGYVICAGTFTSEARRFAQGLNITLWDGQELKARIRGEALQSALAGRQPSSDASGPPCPECRSVMVRRKARQGPRAGQAFLGCSRFPNCRGTRQITSE